LTSGGEAADAAIKIARKWGYAVKGIKDGDCHILTAASCYHGVTLSTVSLASKKSTRKSESSVLSRPIANLKVFGPFIPQVGPTSPSGQVVRFGEIEDLKAALRTDGGRIAAYMIEPIQGAAG
jgi:ornithine--oxo-acid transaminase